MKKLILKKKVALSLAIVSLVSLLVVGVIIFLYIHSVLIENKKKEILSSASEQVHESTLIFKNNQLFTRMLVNETQVKSFFSDHSKIKKDEILNIFLGYTTKEKKYLNISLLDKNGIAVVSTGSNLEGQDYSVRNYFKKAIVGESVIDDAIDKTDDQFGYYFAEPVLGDKGDILGVIAVKVDPFEIDKPISSSEVSKDNYLLLVDEDGVILSSTEGGRRFKSLSTLSDQEKIKLQESGKFLGQEIVPIGYDLVQQGINNYKIPVIINFYDKLDGDNEMVSLNKLNDLPFYLITEIRLDSLNNQVFNTVMMVILIILFILMILSLVIYFVAVQRDILKEKELDKTKTEFVSLASHQLRSPLSAINWYTEMLLDESTGSINSEQRDYLNEISIGNKRMIDLVNDLLNVSRLDMRTFTVETKSVDVIELLKSILNENKPLILEKKLVVEESYNKDIPKFMADEKLLRMVFQNLVTNAVKFTQPSGTIKIVLNKLNKDESFGGKIMNEESLVFSISDSGISIPDYQQNNIFSKLFRADNARESGIEGTGLGLYVVKSIVDQSGGSVWFKSPTSHNINGEENKGTDFYVAFPLSGMKTKIK